MTYNLGRYNLEDRDGHPDTLQPKPEDERERVVAIIAACRPDILAVQEIGQPSVFEAFAFRLQQAGLDYPYTEYLQRRDSSLNLALLSRFPIVERNPGLEDAYSIGEARIPVLRGFLNVDIAAPNNTRIRIINAHLKSKVFHRLGQTEMRRNEARLLHNHIKDYLADRPERLLLVVGDMNDHINSAALREVCGKRNPLLHDLRPVDPVQSSWTYVDRETDTYSRIDYILASQAMQVLYRPEKSGVILHSDLMKASDHRPVLATFSTRQP